MLPTTTLIKTVQNGNDLYEYSYDAVGNITEIKKNGTVYESYTYDSLGQLKLVSRDNSFYDHYYDDGGNLQEVYLNGVVIKSYTYGDANWKDKLTQFNGQTITYDSIGNPLQYRDGFNFTWSNGRQLTGINDNISYVYDADGLRISKNVNGTTTDYYWLNGVLLGQKTGNDYIIYLYDENGTAYGIICNNSYYYYVFNAQGDVVAIIDQNGNTVVQYDYSAWGEIYNISGTLADTLGQQNPIRYRGYYYDNESGFYYLQSRYYDPVTHRFINADGLVAGIGCSVLGYNLFAYCGNNPVNFVDLTGMFFEEIKSIITYIKNIISCFLVIGNIVELSDEQKKFVATVVGEMGGEDTLGRKAVAHSIMNRFYEPRDVWRKVKSVNDVLVTEQYNAVGGEQYKLCMRYLDARNGTNKHYENIIAEIIPIYYGLETDFTGGAHYFFVKKYSKNLLNDLLNQQNRYTEISIQGINGNVYGVFRCEW